MVRPGRAVDGEKRSQEPGAPPLSWRSGAVARREQGEDVGRFCCPSYVKSEIRRNRPVSPRRQAKSSPARQAPALGLRAGVLELPFYRRSLAERRPIMRFTEWYRGWRNRPWARQTLTARPALLRHARLRLEQLEDRTLLSSYTAL